MGPHTRHWGSFSNSGIWGLKSHSNIFNRCTSSLHRTICYLHKYRRLALRHPRCLSRRRYTTRPARALSKPHFHRFLASIHVPRCIAVSKSRLSRSRCAHQITWGSNILLMHSSSEHFAFVSSFPTICWPFIRAMQPHRTCEAAANKWSNCWRRTVSVEPTVLLVFFLKRYQSRLAN